MNHLFYYLRPIADIIVANTPINIINNINCISVWTDAWTDVVVAGVGAVVGVAAGATVAAVHVALTSTATYDEFTTCESTTTATW